MFEVKWRANEDVTASGGTASKYKTDSKVSSDKISIDGNNGNALGTATVISKVEEMPQSSGGSVPFDGKIPQTDKQGMKIMGDSDGRGRDIND